MRGASLVEAARVRLSRRFGPEVATWCAALPGLATEIAARWNLVLDELYPDGASSVAWRCLLSDGAPAALKLSPDPSFLADQAEMLRLLEPSGRVPAVLATAPTQVLLHGDLHLGNVLDGGPQRGLVAIDPKACVGDPCFDAIDYALTGAGNDGVAARSEALAAAAALDPDRLYGWCRAMAPIVAINRC